jgi:23S rRNA (adenine2503-C2)-methyltransferase
MRDIKELNLKELEDELSGRGFPKYQARSIFDWIYQKGVDEFGRMSNLPVSLRQALAGEFSILNLKLAQRLDSSDGTAKFLFELPDKNLIEAVNIPMKKRSSGLSRKVEPASFAMTGCISSQAGCKFGCNFCASGLKGFKRNLSCGEILDEVLYLKNNIKGGNSPKSALPLTHIVFMGTGEPLDNYENLLKAIRIINSPAAFNIGARKITISTCGVIPGIKRLQEEDLQVELSISLHAAVDKIRSQLMPVNNKYPLAALIKCCQDYIAKTNRQITFEYILVKGLNADLSSARDLVNLLKSLRLVKINLIPANAVPELKIVAPDFAQINSFKEYLLKAGLNVTLRQKRGEDIQAACGQLRLKYEKN